MDHLTEYRLAVNKGDRDIRAAHLLIAEAAKTLSEHERQQRLQAARGTYLRDALAASAEIGLHTTLAAKDNERIGVLWGGIATRQPNNSFFLDVPLGTRAALQAGVVTGSYLVETAKQFEVVEAHDTVGSIFDLMSVDTARGPAGNQLVGKLETLPTVSVLANETTAITEQTPTASQSILSPKNLATWGKHSRQWALQSEAAAAAVTRLHVAAVKTKALQQILEGTGSNGQLLGLTANSDVPTAAGTSVDMAKVCTAVESVEKYGTGPFAWIVSAPAAKLLRQRAVISGGAGILADNRIAGYPCYVTGATTNAIAVFGSWADLQVFQWRPIEVAADPFTDFQSGIIGLRAWLSVDAAPMLSKSFYTLTAVT